MVGDFHFHRHPLDRVDRDVVTIASAPLRGPVTTGQVRLPCAARGPDLRPWMTHCVWHGDGPGFSVSSPCLADCALASCSTVPLLSCKRFSTLR